MRKLLAFLVLLMLPWAARGQALADWYYWFDNDEAPRGSGKMSDLNTQLQIDVSQLEAGAHMLYIQVVDTAGVLSTPTASFFCKVPQSNNISKFYFWLDSSTTATELPYGDGQFVVDVSDLPQGFHVINYCALDDEGLMSDIKTSGFYRMPVESKEKLHYWLDGDTIATEVPNYRDGFVVDVTRATEGLNTIYFQMEDNGPADIKAYHFVKIPQIENGGEMTLVCIIDGKIVGEEKVSAHGGVVKCDMDVSNMEVGLHKAMFQLITPSGAGSSIAETYFVRTLTTADIASMQCSYTIDGFLSGVQKGTCTNGAFHFDLPVDQVEDGLHRLVYSLVAENGASTSQGSEWFYKTPLGGNHIIQYDYWLNNKNDEVQSVQLSEPKDPFQLIKLLPVSKEPIRTDCFHFEVNDGSPMMYAKNDIHFRFHDKSGRYIDDSKQYVDYNVQQEVKDIVELMTVQTFERPESDGIKWFKFDSAPGDTITFRSSQATSLQVFAPSGKEIYSTMGDKSVVYGGAHTWEDGTYYVAVHDVTGSKPSITLDYMHMDKYDVVSQDVRVVGNGGCSTITFQGNGFKDLYAIDLKDSKGNIIQSIDVSHESDATTSVTFDFTGVEIGKYDAVFHFTEEDKTFTNIINIEEAKEIKLIANVTCPSAYLKNNTTTFTFVIENKGNSTAYRVPLHIQLYAEGGCKDITYAKFSENIPKPNMDWLDSEIYLSETIDSIAAFIVANGDLLRFINVMDSISGDTFKDSYLAINVAPKSSFIFTITLKSNSSVKALVSMPTDWNFVSVIKTEKNNHTRSEAKEHSGKDKMCCVREQVECVMNVVVAALDFASIFGANWSVADCIAALANEGLSFAYDVWCGEVRGGKNAGKAAEDLRITAINTLLSCLPPGADKYNLGWIYEHIYDVIKVTSDCVKALSYTNNCPQDPPLSVGPSIPVNSLDPNDIYGYISPSGSKFVGEEVLNLPYRIEFENDTTFATASAHTVIVRDTLDSTKFDLASFEPTSIKIGDKNVQLNGEKEFVTTVDMRPEIYAIAQIEGMYDEEKGIATWKFTSLDPMTMEETDDVMQGFLPVNYDGSGIGEVAYNINRKGGLADGTEISNRASIIFDSNDAIETPVWINTIDAVPPTSHVSQLEIVGNDSVCVHFEGEDERSGVWKYELYVQHGEGSGWWKEAETDSTCCGFRFYNNIKYSFCVLATDSAGNVERKEFAPEKILYVGRKGDVNTDGEVNVTDIVYTADHILGNVDEAFNASAADMNDDKEINVTDIVYIADEILNGDVDQRSAVKSNRVRTVTNSADALTIEPFNIDSGETKVVTLEMNNPGYDITAFQCDVTLPNGLHIAKSGNGKQGVNFNKDTKRADASTHSLAAMSKDAGVNRFVCYSITNAPFFGYTGAVIDIPVTADATMADGEYTVLINNITMTCKDKTQLKPAPVMVKISVNNATSVHSLNADDPSAEYYDAGGRKRDTIIKGVNIVRKNDNVNKVIK